MSFDVVGNVVTNVPTAPGASPVLAKAIPCPLCGYDLRGLPAGRCPECGHAFDPAELIRAAELRHPYLFEDHPRRFWWSMPATMIGSLRPGRFWSRLRPEMPPKPGLVVRYWLLVVALCLATALAFQIALFFAGGRASRWSMMMGDISRINLSIEATSNTSLALNRYYLDMHYSMRREVVVDAAFWVLGLRYYSPIRKLWPFAAVLGLWAGGVMLLLQVFRRTLRQARIGTGHVLRVSLYAGDALPMLLILLLLIVVGLRGRDLYHLNDLWNWQYGRILVLEGVFVACVALFSGWRLWQAQRRYLRLPHGVAMVFSIETILALAAFIFLLNVRLALLNYI